VPQQPRDLLERAALRELLHGVAPVQQAVRVRVDLRDRRRVDDDPGEALLDLHVRHGDAS
jgi:hypothetical protein